MRTTGILGGSFNPIHVAHLALAVNARAALGLDEVLLIPARQPPHKPGIDIAPARDRLAMARLAARGLPGVRVLDVEMRRRGPSFTIDTLRDLLRRRPADYVLLLGADMWETFATWREAAALRRLARIAVAARPGHPLPRGVARIPSPALDVSGRKIRGRVRRGLPISFLVPAAVETYILRRHLYR